MLWVRERVRRRFGRRGCREKRNESSAKREVAVEFDRPLFMEQKTLDEWGATMKKQK